MREGDVRSPVSPAGEGRRRRARGEGMGCATRSRNEQRCSPDGTGRASVEARGGAGPKVYRKEGEMRIPREEGIRKDAGGGVEGTSERGREREREGGKRDEGKRDEGRFSATVPSEKGPHAPSNRVDSSTRIGVAGAVPTSLSLHSGAPMVVRGTAISPTAMATWCDNGVRYSPSLKIYSNPPSPPPPPSLFFASRRSLLPSSSAMYLSRSKMYE